MVDIIINQTLFVNKHVFLKYKPQIIAEKKREKEMGRENGKTNKRHIGLIGGTTHRGTLCELPKISFFMQKVVRN